MNASKLAWKRFSLLTLLAIVAAVAACLGVSRYALIVRPRQERERAVQALIETICQHDPPTMYIGPVDILGLERFYAADAPLATVRRVGAIDLSVPRLVSLLSVDDEGVCKRAACVLSDISPDSSLVMPALVDAVKNGDTIARPWAAAALALSAKTQRLPERQVLDSIPSLLDAVKADDAKLRWFAVQALGAIPKQTEETMAAILEATADKDNSVREVSRLVVESMP